MEVRSFDGSGNSLSDPQRGAAGTQLLRKVSAAYEDDISTLAVRGGRDINPRAISNVVCRQATSRPNGRGLTDFTWAWGQFLDHEIDLTEPVSGETASMTAPPSSGASFSGPWAAQDDGVLKIIAAKAASPREPVVVIGHSFGADSALEIAEDQKISRSEEYG